ncbi:MAG: hypothetical protein NTX15_05370, partial [Candidatus Kapabacteria bacterium]|nr:hypothetical protein [Candidatus Kapabacteria bacterium]
MQVLTGYRHDHAHFLNDAGAYEWWYADALSENAEWGVVMIMFRGMPMTPDYLDDPSDLAAGYALSVYHNGVRVAFAFTGCPINDASFSNESPRSSVGSSSFSEPVEGEWKFVIDAPSSGKGKGAHVELTLHSEGASPSTEPFAADHGWVLAAPRCHANVSIKLTEGEDVNVDTAFS